MDPTYPLVPIVNLVSFFLVLLALFVTAGRPWNIGVCMFAIWTALSCLITAVNTIVWRDSVGNVAPVWCDISSRFAIGFNVAIPACSLIITRRISYIACLRNFVEKRQRLREDIIDLLLCIGLPIIVMIDYYVVQGSRFEILEEFGCAPTPIGSGLEIILLEFWYVGLPLVSICLYLPKILYHFYYQRKEMNEFLSSGGSINHSAFLRILALGCLDLVVTLPIGILNLVVDIKENKIVFYQGWSPIHSNWEPFAVTKGMWTNTPFGTFDVKWNEWVSVYFALVFFALFGTTAEARAKYKRVVYYVLRPLGVKPAAKAPELSDVMFGSQNLGNGAVSVTFGEFSGTSDQSSSLDIGQTSFPDLERGKQPSEEKQL